MNQYMYIQYMRTIQIKKKTYNTNNFLFNFSDSWQFVIVIFSYVYNTNEKKKLQYKWKILHKKWNLSNTYENIQYKCTSIK